MKNRVFNISFFDNHFSLVLYNDICSRFAFKV